MKDLLVVVPDKTWQFVVGEILQRNEALGIRKISTAIAVHMGKDGGVRSAGPEFAASLSRFHGYALLLFDYEGCGDSNAVEVIEADLRSRLKTHWADRADAIIVAPEIEVWLWRAVSQVARALDIGVGAVRARLQELSFIQQDDSKPSRPKEAFHTLLREARKIPSAAVYAEIARSASLRPTNCQTTSFQRFTHLLKTWFPPPPSASV